MRLDFPKDLRVTLEWKRSRYLEYNRVVDLQEEFHRGKDILVIVNILDSPFVDYVCDGGLRI